MRSGFEFKIPARGFNLKSWLAFEERLGTDVIVEETTQAVYEHLIYGDPTCPLDSPADIKPKKLTKTKQPSSKVTKSPIKAGKKPSTTKASAVPAKKTTAKKATSSKTTKKPSSGSPARKTK